MSYHKSIIGGYVGPKGGGKSLSLAGLCVEKLVNGERVWSNMPIQTSPAVLSYYSRLYGRRVKPAQTEPLDWNLLYMLDESLVEGTVAIDEIGYFADSRQSFTIRNRLINACIRQVRHRSLDLFYTAFKFGAVDSRIRDETDLLVECDDCAYKPWGLANNIEGGKAIIQKYYDISGVITGRPTNYFSPFKKPYWTWIYHGTVFWNCYDTKEVISLEEAMTGVELDLQKRRITNKGEAEDPSYGIDLAIGQKVRGLASTGETLIAPGDYALLISELGLSNNKNTRAKFRNHGLVYNPNLQCYEILAVREREAAGAA